MFGGLEGGPDFLFCTDGIDNDDSAIDAEGRLGTDCADAGCAGIGDCSISETGLCDDDIDNDLDGMTDCVDTVDCSEDQVCTN